MPIRKEFRGVNTKNERRKVRTMSKKFKMNLTTEFGSTRISEDEYPNIMVDHEITDDEWNEALNVMITYFAQKELDHVIVNLEIRNRWFGDAKEMTIEEIEKELGHKVKIVKEKEKWEQIDSTVSN